MVSRCFFVLVLFITTSCSVLLYRGGPISSNAIECVSKELDGTVTVTSLGNGRNRLDAVEQAKKNSIFQLLFNGVSSNNINCNIRPILPEVNAETKYKDYFNIFFKDNGDYLKYVSEQDEKFIKKFKRYKGKSENEKYFSILLRINLPPLELKLKQDNIIK